MTPNYIRDLSALRIILIPKNMLSNRLIRYLKLERADSNASLNQQGLHPVVLPSVPFCFKVEHELLRKAQGRRLALHFTTVRPAPLLNVGMQAHLWINFKSFHSKEKDNQSCNLLLLPFPSASSQVVLPAHIMLITSLLPSAEMAHQTLFPKSWFFKIIWRSRNRAEAHYSSPSLDNDDL